MMEEAVEGIEPLCHNGKTSKTRPQSRPRDGISIRPPEGRSRNDPTLEVITSCPTRAFRAADDDL